MKCSRLRTALLTFIIGFISVPILNPLYDKWSEPSVDLPQTVSASVIVVDVETKSKRFDWGGGGGGSGCMCGYGSCVDCSVARKTKPIKSHNRKPRRPTKE
jgi:hypothetical protein